MGLRNSSPGPHACTEGASLTEHLLSSVSQLSKHLALKSRMRRLIQCGHIERGTKRPSDPSNPSWGPNVRFKVTYQARSCIAKWSRPHSSQLGSSLSCKVVKTVCHCFLGDRLPLCMARGFGLFFLPAWDSRRNFNYFNSLTAKRRGTAYL